MRPPTHTNAHPLSAREQQLSLWALEVWGGVVPVLLPAAPRTVADAARAVLDSRDAFAHWEGALCAQPNPEIPFPSSLASPHLGYYGTPANGNSSGDGHTNGHGNSNGHGHLNGIANGHATGSGVANGRERGRGGDATPDPPLLAGARDAMVALHDLDRRRATADAYARVVVFVGNLVGSATCVCELGGPPSAHATLPPFPLARPDAVLGINPLNVPVSVGVDAAPLVPRGIKAGLYAASLPNLQTSLCDSPSAPWFPWLFVSLAPLDAGVGAAHINVLTAMRTGLALALTLNTAALERDPANSLPLPPIWRRAYGVYGSGSMWRLVLMVAGEDGIFTTTEIWCGSGTLPVHMLQFIALLSHIAAEAETRRTYVSNWLYSLRTCCSHRDLFQLQSAQTTPRTLSDTALQTPVPLPSDSVRGVSGESGGTDGAASSVNGVLEQRVLRPLPIPIPIPEVHLRDRRDRRSISDLSHVSHSIPFSSSPLYNRNGHRNNSTTAERTLGIHPAPSPGTWMSPTRHGRSASTSLLGTGPAAASASAYRTALLSPFPNRSANTSFSVASQLAAAAERSWSASFRGSGAGPGPASAAHSYATSVTNSASPTLSDPDFGDENAALGLRRF